MVASLLTKREATAKAWVNAGKVDSVEEYFAQIKGTSAEKQFIADQCNIPMMVYHTHMMVEMLNIHTKLLKKNPKDVEQEGKVNGITF